MSVRTRASSGVLLAFLTFAPPSAEAQEPEQVTQTASDPASQSDDGSTGKVGDRIFGVLPNFTTVEGALTIGPITGRQKFHMAARTSLDPYVFPFVGVVAGLGVGQRGVGYFRRYGMSLADNGLGNFMTTAVLPSVLGQDPRYFQLGRGGTWHRIGYAASRSVVTHGRSGQRQFNVSEVGGTALASEISALSYYPGPEQSATRTLTRWGMQLMWDTLSNELKEFWPDVRRHLRKG